jgi:hypothetical protein
MKRVMGILMVLGLALACDQEKGASSTTVTTNTKSESKTVTPGKTTEVTTVTKTTETSAAGDVGVAECDDYLKKMADCQTHVAAAAAGPMKDATEAMRSAWKKAAATAEGKAALATGCTQALDAAKAAYGQLGCNL